MPYLGAMVFISLLFLPTSIAGSTDASVTKGYELTKEERLERAEHLEKMAACLRSDKSISDCHEQFRKDCPMAKDGSCPMWEGPRGMHRRMRGQNSAPKKDGSESAKKTEK